MNILKVLTVTLVSTWFLAACSGDNQELATDAAAKKLAEAGANVEEHAGDKADKKEHAGTAAEHAGDAAEHAGDAAEHAGDAAEHAGDAAEHAGEPAEEK